MNWVWESFLDFLKESRMVTTNGRINGANNFTSISSKGKSVVDYIAVPIENINECISCDVYLVSEIIANNGFETFYFWEVQTPGPLPCLLNI